MNKIMTAASAMLAIALAPGIVPAYGQQSGSAFEFGFAAIDGGALPLSAYRGQVLLVVNTASFCGFTDQYEGLQQLWTTYAERGLVVVGVPSNDFGAQEPKAEAEIKTFCSGAFGITFPLAAKTVVSGAGAHPFYAWAARALPPGNGPKWNFHKYLVGRDGRMIAGFSTTTKPGSPQVIRAIEAALATPAG